ncbi:hypothetical protein SODALDRAFT_93158 [Sodiomyces alkalinus F11]|uniref:Uncharacterized protein n=1 Tax=Sodiomyces alkalinus (strain CBS 110278 / VKM F-3762 / F11) TaxID=1314773 RepID=A0A3N2Q0R7_SODAK|nr:hypothetical protein SODALDRAFT_93158 [Sodiomyces alkalinus F11]ROT40296.1 hypothetical protein SODALDRAFT_93158 [Sodiomyces alkalinus F11]
MGCRRDPKPRSEPTVCLIWRPYISQRRHIDRAIQSTHKRFLRLLAFFVMFLQELRSRSCHFFSAVTAAPACHSQALRKTGQYDPAHKAHFPRPSRPLSSCRCNISRSYHHLQSRRNFALSDQGKKRQRKRKSRHSVSYFQQVKLNSQWPENITSPTSPATRPLPLSTRARARRLPRSPKSRTWPWMRMMPTAPVTRERRYVFALRSVSPHPYAFLSLANIANPRQNDNGALVSIACAS